MVSIPEWFVEPRPLTAFCKCVALMLLLPRLCKLAARPGNDDVVVVPVNDPAKKKIIRK